MLIDGIRARRQRLGRSPSGGIRRARRSPDARSPPGPYRPLARRAADRFRPGDPVRPLPDAGRGVPGPVRPRRLLLRRRCRRMRSASTTTCRKLWFMPATPVLSNGGTQRGLPISCFLNEASDSLEGIVGLWNENVWLASKGGGIGSYWGNLRSIGEKVGAVGKTSGVIPFIRVMDSLTLAISPGLAAARLGGGLPAGVASRDRGVRRDPPPDRRRSEPQGAEPAPRHPGVRRVHARGGGRRAVAAAVAEGRVASVRSISARALWIRILTARIETGEPYLIFSDHVNRARPEHHKLAGLEVKTSNLCSEITLPTGRDQHGMERTAVCCLSLAEPGELVRVAGPSDVHRGRDAVPRQRAAGLHRPRAARDGEGEVFGDARARRWGSA